MSKSAILRQVRAALSHSKPGASISAASYRRVGTLSAGQRLQLLEERLHEYDARVFHATEQDLARQIAGVLIEGKKLRIVHPAGIPSAWLDERISWTPGLDNALSYEQIESFDGVLTGATAAVAESGSIVLQHGPTEGRRALTLLPDYHLCVLFAGQVVETLPECFARLQASAAHPTTFISGPSATADIEMTRIKGVHGPRFLDVFIAG